MSTEVEASARAEWLKARRSSIGASEAAAVLGLHPYHSPMSLYYEKTTEDLPTDEQTEYQEWGHLLEPVLSAKYAKVTGRGVRVCQETRVHPKYSFLSATPDCFFEIGGVEKGPLELKTSDRYQKDEELPIHWQVQNNVQMAVWECQMGSFGILGPFRKFYFADLQRNEPFLTFLIELCQEFWERHVLPGIPPDADGHHATTEALKRLYPKESGARVELASEFTGLTEALEGLKAQIKSLDAEKDAIENKLRASIADATFGVLPDGTGFSLKTVERAGYEVKPSSYRQLRRIKKGIL